MIREDQARGCLLGLALGDAFGAPHEGGPVEQLLWAMIGRKGRLRRYTDDTQMALDIADCLIAMGTLDEDELANRFASSYRFSRGYGPSAAKVLKRIKKGERWEVASRHVHAGGSFGNGAAMRAPVLALLYSGDELNPMVERSARITHGHPLAIAGAQLIAAACACSLRQAGLGEFIDSAANDPRFDGFRRQLNWIREHGITSTLASIRQQLGNGMTAQTSCATALCLALRFQKQSFESLHAAAVALRGDVDTIAAMAGAIWGARHGASALPPNWLAQLEDRERIEATASRLVALRTS